MQIQRLQSLYLLLAFILITVFVFIPFGYTLCPFDGELLTTSELYPQQYAGLLIPGVLAGLMSLAAIFMYNRMPLQKTIVWVSLLLTVATAGLTAYVVMTGVGIEAAGGTVVTVGVRWGGGILLLFAAIIAQFMAVSRIKADQHLLASLDRIR